MSNRVYVIQKTEKSICPDCSQKVDILCRENGNMDYGFYVCWNCKKVWQVGVGLINDAVIGSRFCAQVGRE